MKEREKELSWKENFFEWLTFKFHRVSSDNSQDWLLSLFWIMGLSLIVGMTSIGTLSTIPFMVLILIGCLIAYQEKEFRGWLIFLTIILYYLFYSLMTKDIKLYCISNMVNPFSVMTGWGDLTFGTLVYKIIIAYLIYQLIISIRQNTRRK